ncbi:MAG: NAD-dependent epimerase/dehydratase family protein [Patescibacteria group bacterium]|jgi:UDP-glucose 4-epimerase
MAFYLVTGGAGFVGSNLTDALIAAGHKVRIIDNFSTGLRSNINPQAELVEIDFTDLASIKPHFRGIDGVFHVGALPRIPYSIENPIESTQANLIGTLNVLKAAHEAGVKRVVYSASSSAYGDQPELPLHPAMPANPLNPYALQKYVGEKFCEQFHRFYGLETVSLRYFNLYGPRMAEEGAYVSVIATFKRQKLANQPLTIIGDGEQSRDFTHVGDAVRANMLAMESDRVGHGEVLNVGAGEQYSVNYIADAFRHEKQYLPARPGEIRHTRADISLTKDMLGWEPQVKFEEELKNILSRL